MGLWRNTSSEKHKQLLQLRMFVFLKKKKKKIRSAMFTVLSQQILSGTLLRVVIGE